MRSKTLGLAATLLFAAVSAGCAIVSWVTGGDDGIQFSHEAHAKKEVACIACHEGAEESDRAGMPTKDVCLTCHAEKKDQPLKDFEKKIAETPELTFDLWNKSPDLKFSHAKHFEKGYACKDCHGAVEETRSLGEDVVASMATCIECHTEKKAANECATCHQVLRRDKKPPSHDATFLRMHGRQIRGAEDLLKQAKCLVCHGVDATPPARSCETCHQEMPPDNHTNFWRRKGHGFTAEIDRGSCFACHREDACIRCHEQESPSTHKGNWGGTYSSHCFSCHEPLPSNSCFACHRSTPSHASAPPRPGPPHPGANADCRTCHLPNLLKHADNGESCNNCHK